MKSYKDLDKKIERLKKLSPDHPDYLELCLELGIYPKSGELDILLQEDTDCPKISPKSRTSKINKLRKKDLQQLSYPVLENIFYGFHNILIPQEMADIMNPDEAISKIHASRPFKKYNQHLTLPTDFLELISLMDRTSYPLIGNMAKQCKKPFSNKRGDQIARLSTLDSETQKLFLDSFFAEYRSSNKEQPDNPNAFYDPNIDGRSKTVYINALYNFLK